jgi:hypothetical protein
MSELKVNKISPRSGTDVTLGDSGDAISVASGASLTSPGLTLSDNILFNTSSKGIYLGVTTATASNLLDDYEKELLHQYIGVLVINFHQLLIMLGLVEHIQK